MNAEFKESHRYKRFLDRKHKKYRETYMYYYDNDYRCYSFVKYPECSYHRDQKLRMCNQEYKDIYKLKTLLFINNEGYKFKIGKQYIDCPKKRFDKYFSMSNTAIPNANNQGRYTSNKHNNCGINTGRNVCSRTYGYKDSSRRKYNKYFALQDCIETLNNKHTELLLVYKYKKIKTYNIDEDLREPLCVVCWYFRAGRGRFIFKKCRHGKELCKWCSKQLTRCPVCRADK